MAKETIKLVSLLAKNSEIPSRKLLKKYGKKDAVNYYDLENKLISLYAEKPEQIEKEFANIHPHKELILKHFEKNNIVEAKPITISGDDSQTTVMEKPVKYSNCEGCGGTCGKSNYDGFNNANGTNTSNEKRDMLGIIAVLGIIAIVGVILKK